MADYARQWQTATDNDRMIQTVTHGGRLRHIVTTCALQTVIYCTRHRQTISDHNRQCQLQAKYSEQVRVCVFRHIYPTRHYLMRLYLTRQIMHLQLVHASTDKSCICRASTSKLTICLVCWLEGSLPRAMVPETVGNLFSGCDNGHSFAFRPHVCGIRGVSGTSTNLGRYTCPSES